MERTRTPFPRSRAVTAGRFLGRFRYLLRGLLILVPFIGFRQFLHPDRAVLLSQLFIGIIDLACQDRSLSLLSSRS